MTYSGYQGGNTMSKTFRIKELSKLTSVTVRTLHYYHEIGLLKPSGKTYGGHRLYSEKDMSRLQQIITLKFLGFTLDQIVKIDSMPESSLKKALKAQSKLMNAKAKTLTKASELLDDIVNHLEVNDSVNWKNIAKIIEVIQVSEINQEAWYDKHLTKNERMELEEISKRYTKEFWDNYSRRWDDLFKEVEVNLHTDPGSKIGMQLIKQWLALVDEVYPPESELRKKLWEGYKTGIVPQGFPFNKEVIEYISKATEKYKSQKKG